jgi:hypothetical protein
MFLPSAVSSKAPQSHDCNTIIELLKTESGQRELQDGGYYFGIEIKTKTWNNTIDYGTLQYHSLAVKDQVPIGYEECITEKPIREAIQQFTIDIKLNHQGPETYQIVSCTFLPTSEPDTLDYVLIHPDGSEAIGSEIPSGESTEMELRLNIFPDYQGYVNRWMILTFEGVQQHTQLSSTISRCVMSVRICGCIRNEFQAKVAKSLSTDAAPFIPQIATTYFDTQVSDFSNPYLLTHLFVISAILSISQSTQLMSILHRRIISLPSATFGHLIAITLFMYPLSLSLLLCSPSFSSLLFQIDPCLLEYYSAAVNRNNFFDLMNYVSPTVTVPDPHLFVSTESMPTLESLAMKVPMAWNQNI